MLMRFFVTTLILLVCYTLNLTAQNPTDPKRGAANGASYSISDLENINLTNGNLVVNFPLVSLPAGRGSVGNSFSLVYNSKLYDTEVIQLQDITGQTSNQNRIVKSLDGGWRIVTSNNFSMRLTSRLKNGANGFTCIEKTYIWKLHIVLPDGSKKEFRPTGYSDYFGDGFFNISPNGYQWGGTCGQNVTLATSAPMTYYSTDGSYLKLVVQHDNTAGNTSGANNPWTLYFPDGSNYDSATAKMTDRNGNFIQGTTDTFGRSISYTAGSNSNENFVFMNGVNNEQLKWIIQWKTIYARKAYQTTPVNNGIGRGNYANQTASNSFKVVDKIILPPQLGGLIYQFGYNGSDNPIPSGQFSAGWGELISITLPSSAQAIYEYEVGISEETQQTTTTDVLNIRVKKKTLNYQTEYDGTTTPVSEIWNYSITKDFATVTSPDGNISTQGHGDVTYENLYNGLVLGSSNSNGTMVENQWGFNIPSACTNCANRQINPYVKAEFTSIKDSVGNYILTAIKEFSYDKNGNRTQVKEYDFVPYSSVPRDANGKPTGIPGGLTPARISANVYYNPTPDASNTTTNSPNAYWNSSSPNLRGAISAAMTLNGSNQVVSRNEMFYDNPSTTGNLTQAKSWDSSKGAYSDPLGAGNSISNTVQYNQYGMPVLTTDARGIQTQIVYGTVGGFIDLYPTQVKTAFGLPEQRTSVSTYDFYTGLVKTSTDNDNNVTNETVYDAVGRPVLNKVAVNTPNEVWTQTEYGDQLRRVVVRADLFVKGDGKKVAIQHFDQLGRVRLSRTLEDATTQNPYNEADGIKVQTRYRYDNPSNPASSNGTFTLKSNPYRTGAENEMGWTVSYSDKTGRTSTVKTYGGGNLPAPWGGNGNLTGTVLSQIDANSTMVTDQAGRQRRSITNGIGQLVRVDEPDDAGNLGSISSPVQPTAYLYDTLNNLVQVNQGVQQRNFTYNSLSRLLSATNPESGTIGYGYDNNGNLTQKTDARGVVTNYVYDNINRVVNRTYNDGTPSVTYTYDNPSISFSKGRLTQVTSAISTTNYNQFDNLGRVLASQQITDGQTYNFGYSYNLSGALVNQTYPSGRVVTNQFEVDGDLAQVNGSFQGQNKTYVGNLIYTSTGAVSSLQLGNGKWENTMFNSRLQPVQIGLGNSQNTQELWQVNYDYGTTDNNGNVRVQQITVPGQFTASQVYNYDSLNRLKQAAETIGGSQTWKQTFAFDRYGNRNFDAANTTTLGSCPANVCNPAINPNNNRVTTHQFDNAGNTTIDAEGKQFFYDAENKQKEVRNGSNQIIGQYLYDGDGKRVKKIATNDTTVFVYDASGKLAVEIAPQIKENIYAGSRLLAEEEPSGISYLTNDTLGSPRILTNANGVVISRRDFMPYGEEISRPNQGTDTVRQKFTSYERDIETNLDYAQARYYSNNLGRFNTVDPVFESIKTENPQSMNRYSYTLNNPLIYIDPDGELWILVQGEQNPKWVGDKCPEGYTCLTAVALENEKGGLNVYGSKGADDVTGYDANKDGQIDVRELSKHHDAQFIVADGQNIPEEFLSVNAAGSLFNIAEIYSQTFKDDEKLVFTAGNLSNGQPCTGCHGGHRGNDIDIRYMGADGKPLTGDKAYENADVNRTKWLINAGKAFGFLYPYTGDDGRFGLPDNSPKWRDDTEKVHRHHLHIGKTAPKVRKK